MLKRLAIRTPLTEEACSNYIVAMKTNIVRIGNSRGVRIPKPFLEESRLGEEVEIEVHGNQIVIRSPKRPRDGWKEAFRLMAERGDDLLLDAPLETQTTWDQNEWEW